MKPRRFGYGRGRRAAALLLLLLCLCLSSMFLLLLHSSSAPLEPAAGAAGARVAEAQAEVEEAPLPPGNSKVAFLFIARNRLPLELVWDAFFRVRIRIPLKFRSCFYRHCSPHCRLAAQCR
jgi:hypothetical protein